ncbi:MAG: ComF family protein [Candidatus Obscuribacterales bacterium]|nr:ComF family protein [Candidatus Obscuribacterales bacterium]
MTNFRIFRLLESINSQALICQEQCRWCKAIVDEDLFVCRKQILEGSDRRQLDDIKATGNIYKPDDNQQLLCLCKGCSLLLQTSKPNIHSLRIVTSKTNKDIPVVTAAIYKGPLKKLIRRLKYDDDRLAARDLALISIAVFTKIHLKERGLIDTMRQAILVPVPLHPRRLSHRGYNQAGLIARHLSKLSGAMISENILIRTRDTAPQYGLSRAERRENIENAFLAVGRIPQAKTIILVDDVFTSGNTIGQCASALLQAGSSDILALTVARGPQDVDTLKEKRLP